MQVEPFAQMPVPLSLCQQLKELEDREERTLEKAVVCAGMLVDVAFRLRNKRGLTTALRLLSKAVADLSGKLER